MPNSSCFTSVDDPEAHLEISPGIVSQRIGRELGQQGTEQRRVILDGWTWLPKLACCCLAGLAQLGAGETAALDRDATNAGGPDLLIESFDISTPDQPWKLRNAT